MRVCFVFHCHDKALAGSSLVSSRSALNENGQGIAAHLPQPNFQGYLRFAFCNICLIVDLVMKYNGL